MIRNLKVLGLALVAVLAMTAVSASAASAASFTSSAETTFIHGNQATENVFTVNNRTVKCSTATFSGQQSGTSAASVTIHPTYSNCTAFGLSASVTTTGCDYVFTAAGSTSVVCSGSNKIIVNAPGGCTVEIGSQANIPGGVDFTNQGAGSSADILVTSTANSIKATVSGSVLICGTNGLRENGTYTGTVTTKGFSDSGLTTQVGISHDA